MEGTRLLPPGGLVDVSTVVSRGVSDLFEAAQTSIVLIGASEAPRWADLSGTRLGGMTASPLRSDEAGVTAAVRDHQDRVSVYAVDLRGRGHWLPAWKPDWCFE